VANDVLELISQGIIQEIMSEFLFGLKIDNDPLENTKQNKFSGLKCKSLLSRVVAFNLAIQLCCLSPANYSCMVDLLQQLHKDRLQVPSWDYHPSRYGKADSGFVGIKNLSNMLCEFLYSTVIQYTYSQ